MSVIYKATLTIGRESVQQRFNRHNADLQAAGIKPELRSLVFLRAEPQAISEFGRCDTRMKDENLVPSMMADAGVWPGMR